MKKNLILASLFLVLAFVAYKLYEKNRVNTKMSQLKEERDFTVESKESIYKIVLERVGEKPLVFTKVSEKEWYLNEKLRADEVVVGYMVQVLTKAKIHSIPSKNAQKSIQEYLKLKGITVTVFDKEGNQIKKLQVGSDLQKGESTYFLLDGFEQAYALELPGLGGGLRSRFEQKEDNYRDRFIYREPKDKIVSITVDYTQDSAASYTIEKVGTGYTIRPQKDGPGQESKGVNQNKIETYLSFFELLGAELLYNHYEKRKEVEATPPFCTITLTRSDTGVKVYKFWDYDKFVRSADERGRSVDAIHINRFFVSTGEDFYTVQSEVFGKVFSAYSYFF